MSPIDADLIMRTVAGEFGIESRAAACFKSARTRDVHVVLARSACGGRALSESASTDDLSQRYGQPYAQRGHVCVWCMVLCVALRVPGGQRVNHITCRDGRPLPGPKKVDSYYTNFSFVFWTVCRCNASQGGLPPHPRASNGGRVPGSRSCTMTPPGPPNFTFHK